MDRVSNRESACDQFSNFPRTPTPPPEKNTSIYMTSIEYEYNIVLRSYPRHICRTRSRRFLLLDFLKCWSNSISKVSLPLLPKSNRKVRR